MDVPTFLQTHDLKYSADVPLASDIKILHFGDLHWRSSSPGARETQIEKILQNHSADLWIFSGDSVNRHRFWPEFSQWLGSLPGPEHRFAVPGNWDYTRGGMLDAFTRVWSEAGFQVLRNRATTLSIRGTDIQVAGLGDLRADRVDMSLATTEIPPQTFRIVVSHNPDVLLYPEPLRCHLLLCGHTHGGQIRFPGWGAMTTSTRLGRKFDKGVFRITDSQYVFITKGIGSGRVPLRIACPPEVAQLTVRTINS